RAAQGRPSRRGRPGGRPLRRRGHPHRLPWPAHAGGWPRHRLHPGVGHRRQPLSRPRPARCLQRRRGLHPRRAQAGHTPRAQRRARARALRRASAGMTSAASACAAGAPEPLDTAIALEAADGHRYELLACIPDAPRRSLLWLPALGVAARHYTPFAQALARRGVAVFLHEWRGHGSSSLRAGRSRDWGYRELLTLDMAASEAALAATAPGLSRIVGGHSLGGQLASCRLGQVPDAFEALWLVGSGAPYWRAF